MRNHGREFVVGVVFFTMLGALAILTIVLGGDVLAAREKTTFRFDNVAGLTEGSEVWINGLPSGTVKNIRIEPDGTVLATAGMKHGLGSLNLANGVKVEVKEKSSLGGAVISIETTKPGQPAPPDAPKSVEQIEQRTWTAKAGGFGAIGETAMKELDALTEKKPGFLGKALGLEGTGDVMKDIRDVAAELKSFTADLKNPDGTLHLRDDVREAVANLKSLTDQASKGEGTLGLLMNDKEMRDKVKEIVDTLETTAKDIREGKGSLGKFLKDDAVYEDIRASVASLKKFTGDLDTSEGLLPRLVRDKKMAEDFEATLADARLSLKDLGGVVADIRAGRGTVGKLVTDEALYNDIKDAVRSIQRSFEEARENAPILTFAGFLFKTF
jgi:phospholipid/cholesterol/gamma-HCH transport system substrate-binding protein